VPIQNSGRNCAQDVACVVATSVRPGPRKKKTGLRIRDLQMGSFPATLFFFFEIPATLLCECFHSSRQVQIIGALLPFSFLKGFFTPSTRGDSFFFC
jgi:hypothetical protein